MAKLFNTHEHELWSVRRLWARLRSLLEVDPKVARLWGFEQLDVLVMLVLALIADDVSLTPRDDVLIDIDDKEPLIPVQVWKKSQRWEDSGFLLCVIWGNLCGYRAGVESDADVRSCLVVTFLLQLPPLFSPPLLHHATMNNHKLILLPYV